MSKKYCCGEFKHHVEKGDIVWNENGEFSNWGIFAGKELIFDISYCPFCGIELVLFYGNLEDKESKDE